MIIFRRWRVEREDPRRPGVWEAVRTFVADDDNITSEPTPVVLDCYREAGAAGAKARIIMEEYRREDVTP